MSAVSDRERRSNWYAVLAFLALLGIGLAAWGGMETLTGWVHIFTNQP